MKAVQVRGYGGSDMLALADVAVPDIGDGEALVKISHAGVNFIDVYMRSGVFKNSTTYPNVPPFTPGMEAAGVVEDVGASVDSSVEDIKPGDRVAYCLSLGGYAEYASIPAWKLVKVPDAVPLDVAAALQLQGMTAHYLTHSLYPLKDGDSCLIHAGAGGMGQLAIQLAKMRGAKVLVTVGSAEKAEIAKKRGADHAILYRDVDFAEAVRDITDGEGVNVVYDSVGKDTIRQSIKCLKPRGVLSNNGNASGPIGALDPLDLAEAGSVFFTRPHLADYIPTPEARAERSQDLYRLYGEGRLTVTLDRSFPLADAKAAHDALEARQSKGKLLLAVGEG
ncbi:MAG TPA: quinone oxidoreductase [Rhodospirillales bacterium]|jgi:NADPH2:quinone reductase|nr:quinone oxidoreductase [Rhodospirillales bacterium]